MHPITFDPRIQLPNHAIFVGASMSGKTRLVLHLLTTIEVMNPIPRTIMFLYDQFQDVYKQIQEHLKSKGIKMILSQRSNLHIDDLEKREHQTLVIIDDATEETASSYDIAKITTNGRHKNTSLWLIWHSLYSKNPAARLITQNVSYLFFLPSVRLTSQIHTLDTQLRYKGLMVSAYNKAIEETNEHRYLLVDLAPTTPTKFRLRSNITGVPQYIFL